LAHKLATDRRFGAWHRGSATSRRQAAWGADPAPQAVTVTVLDAGGVPSLTFLLEDAVPISYIVLDGLDADSPQAARERMVVRCQAIRRVPAPAVGGPRRNPPAARDPPSQHY